MSTLFRGRINRSTFLFSLIGLGFFAIIPSALLQETKQNSILIIPGFLLAVINMLLIFSVWIRRFHDLNKNGKWAFILFLPVINTFVLVGLLFIPGNKKQNNYGPTPDKLMF